VFQFLCERVLQRPAGIRGLSSLGARVELNCREWRLDILYAGCWRSPIDLHTLRNRKGLVHALTVKSRILWQSRTCTSPYITV
jgi:hypothetical protein